MPDATRIFVGHDYKAPGREEFAWETTVGEQKARNVHVGGGTSKEAFTEMRDARDAELAMPAPDRAPRCRSTCAPGTCPNRTRMADVFLKVPVNKL